MKRLLQIGLLLLFVVGLGQAAAAQGRTPEEEKAWEAVAVLQAFAAMPEQGIPPALLREAQAVVVIPGTVKFGFLLAGRFGQGFMLVRDDNNAWGLPFVVNFTGGSVGWQVGLQATDVVLVFKNRKGIKAIRDGKFTLGADAAVAAGPVGRHLEAATDIRFNAEVYSYSRAKGVFAGVALEGTALQPDRQATSTLYNRPAELVPQPDTVIPQAVRALRERVVSLSL